MINFVQKIKSELKPKLDTDVRGMKHSQIASYRKARSKNDKNQRRILNRVKNSNRR